MVLRDSLAETESHWFDQQDNLNSICHNEDDQSELIKMFTKHYHKIKHM